MNAIYNYLFKYIIVGYPNAGKTSILGRFLNPQTKWMDFYEPTLGLQFGSRMIKIEQSIIKLMVWDTAGQETFRSLIRSYYKGAIVCFLVFDITNRNSMDSIVDWLRQVRSHSHQQIKLYLVGNKIDLEHNRNVSREEAEEFVLKHGLCGYWQVSAKDNLNIQEMFLQSAQDIISDLYDRKIILSADMNIGIKIGVTNNTETSIQLAVEEKPRPSSQNSCEC